jgi:hypothetical protein
MEGSKKREKTGRKRKERNGIHMCSSPWTRLDKKKKEKRRPQ